MPKRIFQSSGGGKKGYGGFPVSQFIALSDCPASYAGAGLKFVTVKAGENGLEFTPLPPLAITDTFVVGSQAAMLALTAQTGDVAIRTDTNQSFILQGSDPAILANWVMLLVSPTHLIGGAEHIADTIANVNTKLSDGDMITTLPNEINLLPAKANAAPLDLLMIENVTAGNAKNSINISSLPFQVRWQIVDITHIDFQIAALTKSNTLFSLPAGCLILGARLKVSSIFTGPAITQYFLSIGIAGDTDQILTEYETKTITPADTEYAETFCFQSFNYNAAVNLLITARSIGANLSTSTGGAARVEIYYIPKAY